MISIVTGPRILLRRLRAVMAKPKSPQARLNEIVVAIAGNMVAEVCSVYGVEEDGSLRLIATEGLNPEAVNKTKLKVGEGLVGNIAATAEPLTLTDARKHPAFAYRPETGEEIYHSFLGVPILHGGRTIGVLVVQNRTKRIYSEEEVETLETVAMVLSEVVAQHAGDGRQAVQKSIESAALGVVRRRGAGFAEGIGIGHVVLHEPRIHVTNLIADNIAEEQVRLDGALGRLRDSIDAMLLRPDFLHSGEHREVIEAYRMFAHDRGWVNRMHEAVSSGLTAEAAIERVLNDTRARLARQPNPLLRERLHDLDDLAHRLLRHLTGQSDTAAGQDLPRDTIIFARNMGPAALLDYDPKKLRGVVLEEGSPTSHVAIVARALDVPLVGKVVDILDIVTEGDPVIIDGQSGDVYLRYTGEVEESYKEKLAFRTRQQARFARLSTVPAVSGDGIPVEILLNAGLLVDLPHLEQTGASGIGLFRTELHFMVAARFPRLNEQVAFYRSVLDAAGEKSVTFRALDIGGDKTLPYLTQTKEDNPALGWRAMRLALERPALFRIQMRALLKAAAGRELRVIFPMIADVREFRQVQKLFRHEREHLLGHGHDIATDIRLGVMIEVPSLLWQLDHLLPLTDFVSLGTNDLLQFVFACDRSQPKLSGRYDLLSPTMLQILDQVAAKAREHDTPLTLCGEMAGRPLEMLALLALGYRSLSMNPASVGPVKSTILNTEIRPLEQAVRPLIHSGKTTIRPELAELARKQGLLEDL